MPVRLTIKNYRCFVSPTTIDVRPGFTAFIGVNNAGKSALIRFLIEFRQLFQISRDTNHLASKLWRGSHQTLNLSHVFDTEEAFSNLNNEGITLTFDFGKENIDTPGSISKIQVFIPRNLNWEISASHGDAIYTFANSRGFSDATHLQSNEGGIVDFGPFLDLMEIFANTLYIGPFRNIINVGANTSYFDIQIGDAFVSQFRNLKTGSSKRDSIGIQSLIEDVRRIFEFDSLAIDPSSDNHSLHITVNGKPFKQHELGSGLSQFIVVLANAAIRRPSLILIDEPELNLHPRLQLDFLTALASYATSGVWFSTHSLGLARSSAELIYSVQRVRDGNSVVNPLEGTVRPAELLGELSFSSQKELGMNQILLVEGPTEVKVIQQLLRAKKKDHKVVLLPMYGHMPDEVEIDEILRITPNIAALIDSEKDSAQATLEHKRQNFVEMFRQKGLRAHVLERRATENYFSDSEIKLVFGDEYRALAPYERLKDATPHWGKMQNWKLAAGSADEINATDLGRFLDSL